MSGVGVDLGLGRAGGTATGGGPRLGGTARRGPRVAVADGLAMTRRNMAQLARSPEEISLYFSLPILFVLVFGYVFGSGMQPPDGGNYREFLVPGVFAMTMLHGMGATATSLAFDISRGVVDRFRAMPTARSALLVGRCLADQLRALLEMVALLVCGLLVGWEWNRGLGRALVAVGLLLLLRMAISWIGVYLALLLPNPDVVGVVVFPLAFPLTALSCIFVAPELMPGWLGTIAEWNPLSATVAASRELFGNPGLGGDSWVAEHALLLAVAWPLAIIAVFAPLAVRRYQRLTD
ncbi:ABC transporter permease [Streptomyces sp. DSM 44915]|uniref:Transport permease protein n=1 Tax=Streptomyces chisholmiae TaxID=3075540 RepID=A0ABU2JZJ5_9ACTN|nr:ABC transporter permease [Streptomyces sp. DSM 44915]MDT0270416.1 ABC transporter permease [Streptomyces sp. DSM 44915]